MFDFWKRTAERFFSIEERKSIVAAIQQTELRTSGEIRLFVESRCKAPDSLDRAAYLFHRLRMQHTAQHNGVLVYLAMNDRRLAIYADRGIYTTTGEAFWQENVQKMLLHFNKNNYYDGVIEVIRQIGAALSTAFPYDAATDKNELPDDIIFGR